MAAEVHLRPIIEIFETGMLDAHRTNDAALRQGDLREIFLVASRMIGNGEQTPESMKGRRIKDIVESGIAQKDIAYQKYLEVLMQVSDAYRAIYQVPKPQPQRVEQRREVDLIAERMRNALSFGEFQQLEVSELDYSFSALDDGQRALKFVFSQSQTRFSLSAKVGAFFSVVTEAGFALIDFCRIQIWGMGSISEEERDQIQVFLEKHQSITIIIAKDDPHCYSIRLS
jgi:hypothetical protein